MEGGIGDSEIVLKLELEQESEDDRLLDHDDSEGKENRRGKRPFSFAKGKPAARKSTRHRHTRPETAAAAAPFIPASTTQNDDIEIQIDDSHGHGGRDQLPPFKESLLHFASSTLQEELDRDETASFDLLYSDDDAEEPVDKIVKIEEINDQIGPQPVVIQSRKQSVSSKFARISAFDDFLCDLLLDGIGVPFQTHKMNADYVPRARKLYPTMAVKALLTPFIKGSLNIDVCVSMLMGMAMAMGMGEEKKKQAKTLGSHGCKWGLHGCFAQNLSEKEEADGIELQVSCSARRSLVSGGRPRSHESNAGIGMEKLDWRSSCNCLPTLRL